MQNVNILVFPCGSEIGLELNRSLKDISFITLYGASSVSDHGKYVFENYIEGLPFVDDPNFIEQFNCLLQEKQIDYIYPAMDQVIDILSKYRDRLKAELIAPCNDAVVVCKNKLKTYERLKGLEFTPKSYVSIEDVDCFPVVIKPQEGYGSKGFQVLKNKEELLHVLAQKHNPIVLCEYLSGDEYTVDCFTNRYGELQYIGCRNRGRIRNGISVNSRIQTGDPQIREIAHEISAHISMRGAWFFQLKKNDYGEYKLLEIATRIAGTMCLERNIGVNLPLLSIFDWMGFDVEITPQFENIEVDRALYNAFCIDKKFSEIYVDFDDTLIVHGHINTNLIKFLYQCVNNNIPIYLVTKHDADIHIELQKYCVAQNLFDKIVLVSPQKRKCDYIDPKKEALFIDDSFVERKQMQDVYGITCLGADAIECLIDYKF